MNTYSIKIALRGVSPMIWRRMRVRGNTSLADLHHIIQIAMSWENDHLHCFHIYGEDYGIKYDGGMDFTHNARQVFLDDFGFDVGDRFTYTYDFTTYLVPSRGSLLATNKNRRVEWRIARSL